jgi:hypothetical protein
MTAAATGELLLPRANTASGAARDVRPGDPSS